MGIGHGTQFRRGNGQNPETFAMFAETTNIDGPNLKQNFVDRTNHQSPDKFEEFAPGLKSVDSVKMDAVFKPASYNLLLADFNNQTKRNWQIHIPQDQDGPAMTFQFTGYVENVDMKHPVKETRTHNFAIKVSGGINLV